VVAVEGIGVVVEGFKCEWRILVEVERKSEKKMKSRDNHKKHRSLFRT
jgi:hypothetical protein